MATLTAPIQQPRRGVAPAAPVFLSVVIPAFNEEQRIGQTLRRVFLYLGAQSYTHEVIVVDDGSRDRTLRELTRLQRDYATLRIVPSVHNRGKGSAVALGMEKARGKFVLMMDADGSVSIEQVREFLDRARRGSQVLVGSRYRPGARVERRQPWYRRGWSRVGNLVFRGVLVRGVKDAHCGFKLFPMDVARDLFRRARIRGFGFDMEVLALARRLGKRIEEVPVRWSDDPRSTVRPLVEAFRTARDLVRIRLNLLLGRYALAEQET